MAHVETIIVMGFCTLYHSEVVRGVCVVMEGMGWERWKHLYEEGLLCQVVVSAYM